MPPRVRITRWGRIRVRALRSGETAAVDEVFAGMSAASRHRRFHAPVPSLSDRALAALTDVDGHRRVALVAEMRDRRRWRAVGIARYVRGDGDVAEVAVAVVDDRQGRGVARRLLTELRRHAVQAGVAAFTGSVQRDNAAALALLRSLFPDARRTATGPVVEFTAPLDRPHRPEPLTVDDVLADLGVPAGA